MAVKIDFDADFDAQAAQARAQRVMLPKDFYRLPAEKRAQAFTVSWLARLDQVQAVADALAKFQANGGTFEDFRKWAADQDWSLPRHRLETIYRNAVQTAYMAGHWRRFDEVKDDLPYLMYDAINDSRVRPSHLAMDGVIRPVNDPLWKRWTPPCGHRCRCTLRQVSAREAQRRGGVTQSIPAEAVPDEGWGGDPRRWGETLDRVRADKLAKAHPALAAGYERAMRQPQGLFTDYDAYAPLVVPDTSTAARAAAVEWEKRIRHEPIEHGISISASGTLILSKIGQADRVAYSDAEMALMRGSTFTHNHPNGLSFSVADFRMAVQHDFAELRAVTPAFRHIMTRPEHGWPSLIAFEGHRSDAARQAILAVRDLMVSAGMHPRYAEMEATHQFWVFVAKRFGIGYTRERS
ncbi:MAG: phage minor head protein [Hylemonella sp.]